MRRSIAAGLLLLAGSLIVGGVAEAAPRAHHNRHHSAHAGHQHRAKHRPPRHHAAGDHRAHQRRANREIRGGHHRRFRHDRIRGGMRPVFAGLTTISTAAGIKITVAADDFATRIDGFIRDVVAAGYHPSRITCYSMAASHVPGSLHKTGHACDFNQHGWGLTDRFMYHVRQYAAKWGLRDGCTFRDCGHIDAGIGVARAPWPRTLLTAQQ